MLCYSCMERWCVAGAKRVYLYFEEQAAKRRTGHDKKKD